MYIYHLGYASPLEYQTRYNFIYNDTVELSMRWDHILFEFMKNKYIVIKNLPIHQEKEEFILLSYYQCSSLHEPIHEEYTEEFRQFYFYITEAVLQHKIDKKEMKYKIWAEDNGHPCYYDLFYNWLDRLYINYPYDIVLKTKKRAMYEIHKSYQPGGNGYEYTRNNFYKIM